MISTASYPDYSDFTPTTCTSTTYSYYIGYKEEVDEDIYIEKPRPPSFKPPKGTFRLSRGSYKGVAKSARNKNKKLNR